MNIEFSFHSVDLFSVENAAMKGVETRSLYVSCSLKAALGECRAFVSRRRRSTSHLRIATFKKN